LPKSDEQRLQFYNDQEKFEIEGIIITEPETGDKSSSFQFSANKITVGSGTKEISGKAIIRVPRYSEYHYGDILRVSSNLETPPQFADFDYKDYLYHQGIYSMMYYPKIEILRRDMGNKALSFIYSIRYNLSHSISRSLPEPQCSLAQGILLGLRGNIPDSLTQAFSTTGTTHILAISGLNLSIIIGMLLSVGVWLFGRRYSISIWLALATIWLYAIITGLHPPIIRGAIMGSMFLFAECLGRQRSASTALTFAAAIMVGIGVNP
jgi:competence protein ComEC